MGYAKQLLEEPWLRFSGQYVCADCFDDPWLKAYVKGEASAKECDYCGAASDEEDIAAPADDVLLHIRECIYSEYTSADDAGNTYDNEDGRYVFENYDCTRELLEEVGLYLPNDDNEDLLDSIISVIEEQVWSPQRLLSLTELKRLRFGWEQFCETVKHRERFFIQRSADASETTPDVDRAPTTSEMLPELVQACAEFGLLDTLPKGTRMFRARKLKLGPLFAKTLDYGPPPAEHAQQNRMSPAGIPMLYAATDAHTAVAEICDGDLRYVVAELELDRDARVLDLTKLPPRPTIFADDLTVTQRHRLQFLHDFARDVSKPIERDDRIHVEYIPTQFITEFLKLVYRDDGAQLDGIVFASSRRKGGKNVTLFADRYSMLLPDDERQQEGIHHAFGFPNYDAWIRVVDRRICTAMISCEPLVFSVS